VNYTEGEVGHALRELESLQLVREEWGARVAKYRHRFGKALNLHSRGIALLTTLMLRGPQTSGELKSRCQRMFDFDDLDDVQYALGKLEQHDPPLVVALPRQPGQKEGRFAHLLCGKPDIEQYHAPPSAQPAIPVGTDMQDLVARVEQLEQEVARLTALMEGAA
ncbi:MAG: YceH family protein, partial [Gammaproteobacteria bacterium]|nr:YceH family protein [Gammaproteobacteria bacterium]